ncbi:glycosyl transferase, partial [Candidatus Pacearchaeota archaeon CG_4_9_14_0_2_um_filter_39_13]
MKLIVQIPAYNEEDSIQEVIKSIPKKLPGIKKIEILVIDDGSRDKTSESAKKAGADYVIRNTKNQGLAKTFQKGMNFALSKRADIIVNTDADNQYNQSEIPKLIKPIIDGKADIVSGNRQVESLNHMIPAKKYGNIIGSKVVKLSAGYPIIDASSGFRAYSREAALKLFVTSTHTYTHETLIQSAHKDLKVIEIPVEFKERRGNSKLISSVGSHVKKSMATIIRSTLMYNSFKFFTLLGAFLTLLGAVPMIRWLWLSYLDGHFGQHTQSLLLGLILLMFGGFSILIAFLADIIAINRRHLEEIMYLVKADRL